MTELDDSRRREARQQVRRVEAWLLDQGVPFVVRFAGGRRLLARMVPGLLFIVIGTLSASAAAAVLGVQDKDLVERLDDPQASEAATLLAVGIFFVGILIALVVSVATAHRRRRDGDRVAGPRAGIVLIVILTIVPIGSVVTSGNWLGLLQDLLVTALLVGALALLVYSGLGALVGWGVRQVVPHHRDLLRLLSRALPLQLVLVAFLFINTEAWQVASALGPLQLLGIAVFFAVAGLAFIIARVPGELAEVKTELTEETVRDVCSATPLDPMVDDLVVDDLTRHPLSRRERLNLVLTVVFSVGVQVLSLGVLMFLALVFFGATAIQDSVIASWVEHEPTPLRLLPGLPITYELIKVSVVIASFAALQFATQAVTEQSFRTEFFDDLVTALSRTLVAREVYLSGLDRHQVGAGLPADDLDDDLDRVLDPEPVTRPDQGAR